MEQIKREKDSREQDNIRQFHKLKKQILPNKGIGKGILKKEVLFLLGMLLIAVWVTGYGSKLLKTQLLIQDMIGTELDYEAFRKFQVSEASINRTRTEINHLLSKKPELRGILYIDQIGFFTFSMMARNYDLSEHKPVDEVTFLRGIAEVSSTNVFHELYRYYGAILTNLIYFPVPRMETADISYSDSWYGVRNYGGRRKHEGTDLMASNKERGFFPVISMTDGIVEKMGWLEQGGYRVGIRSEAGGYFYYAHLSSYAPELKTGDRVIAGQVLGFMGDSGYGPEGTVGQFDVHLHLGIYVSSDVLGTGEMSVNPYYVLRILEKNRTYYKR